MIKTAWLVMMIVNAVPVQQSGEHTQAECIALIRQHALATHDQTHVGEEWYCQPVIRWEPAP